MKVIENNSVLVLMATYNSENFIRLQLESLINQTYKNWKLIVQDDKSTDATLKIIEEYSTLDTRITYRICPSNRHGAYANFHSLLEYAKTIEEYDFYMFSDHDDIWDSNKIEVMVDSFEGYDNRVPKLTYGDMRLINENNLVTDSSLDALIGMHYTNKMTTMFAHKVYGCNTIFNLELLKKLPKVDFNSPDVDILSHDNFVTKVAALYGDIGYIKTPLMGYRRYSGNVTAGQSYDYGIKRIMNRIKGIDKLAEDHALIYKQTIILLHKITDLKISDKILELLEKGGMSLFYFIIRNRISWGNKIKDISHIFILISGKYKKYL